VRLAKAANRPANKTAYGKYGSLRRLTSYRQLGCVVTINRGRRRAAVRRISRNQRGDWQRAGTALAPEIALAWIAIIASGLLPSLWFKLRGWIE
jgi:hypothetical protein